MLHSEIVDHPPPTVDNHSVTTDWLQRLLSAPGDYCYHDPTQGMIGEQGTSLPASVPQNASRKLDRVSFVFRTIPKYRSSSYTNNIHTQIIGDLGILRMYPTTHNIRIKSISTCLFISKYIIFLLPKVNAIAFSQFKKQEHK